jgi:hypothetical protein
VHHKSRTVVSVVAGIGAVAMLAACSSGASSSKSSGGSYSSSTVFTPDVSTAEVNAVLTDVFGSAVDTSTLDPTLLAAIKTAAQPVTAAEQTKLLQCYKALGTCDLGRPGITIGIAEPNIKQSPLRQLSIASYLLQAIQSPEVGKVICRRLWRTSLAW